MFRRGSGGARGNTAHDDQGAQSLGAGETTKTRVRPAAETAKGRPTPKRSEAVRGRRQGITGSRAGSAARGSGAKSTSTPEERRAERIRRQQAMRQGEDWALLPRDRGPVKALSRDYVDSRRHVGEYLFYLLIVVIVLTFIKVPVIQTYSTIIALVMFVVVGIDVSFQVRAIRRLAEQRLPGQSTRGLGFYVGMRTINPRRLRSPAPRVRRGQAI
ncbi:MAG TPA: DUF3043 domain-containing protein [Streptosporangiaceae bacterium]